jgi:hypothetical protein
MGLFGRSSEDSFDEITNESAGFTFEEESGGDEAPAEDFTLKI